MNTWDLSLPSAVFPYGRRAALADYGGLYGYIMARACLGDDTELGFNILMPLYSFLT